MAVISDCGHDKLLIANNLSDNVVLLDPFSGKILQTFELSTSGLVPSSYPYTCVATRDGRRAWCSLWNASQVVELDLTSGKVVRWIKLEQPGTRSLRARIRRRCCLSPDEKTLYVALSNSDEVAAVSTAEGDRCAVISQPALLDRNMPAAIPRLWRNQRMASICLSRILRSTQSQYSILISRLGR